MRPCGCLPGVGAVVPALRLRAIVVAILVTASACQEPQRSEPLRVQPVELRDIVITARAAGVIAPITTIDVKSQASGEITEVHVNEGDIVERGQLLMRVDPRIPQNAVAQAEADLVVARAALENAEARLERAEQLFKEQVMTQEEFENARLERATVYAQLISRQRALEDARIASVQTEVRAPTSGVILSRAVEVGSVIASASRDVGGGAVLLRMAKLETVEVRAMVDETDIGQIHAGQPVTISVAAYPGRRFSGSVLRIGAEAVVEQNVTRFPVLVRIPNEERLLKPGMNAEVEIRLAEAQSVPAVPNAALRFPDDLPAVGPLVGVSSDSLQAMLRVLKVSTDDFVVLTVTNGGVRVTLVETGLTDFDYSVVHAGLVPGDSVIILPTAGLLEEQSRRAEWAQRRAGEGPLNTGGRGGRGG